MRQEQMADVEHPPCLHGLRTGHCAVVTRLCLLCTSAVMFLSLSGCHLASQWILLAPHTYIAGWDEEDYVPGYYREYELQDANGAPLDGSLYIVTDYGSAPARHREHTINKGLCTLPNVVDRRWVSGTEYREGLFGRTQIGMSFRNGSRTYVCPLVPGYVPVDDKPWIALPALGVSANPAYLIMKVASPEKEMIWIERILDLTAMHGREVGQDRTVALRIRRAMWDRWTELYRVVHGGE
jgi:hypothetical protein